MSDLPEVLETLVLGPDDKLLIVVPKSSTNDDCESLRDALDRRGFGERTLIVAGIEQLAVLKA